MSVRVQIGPGVLSKRPGKFGEELKKAQLRALHAVGKAAVSMLHFQSAAIKDLGTFQTGWRYRAAFNRLYLENVAAHAEYVERGRLPGGRMPPVSIISAWAVRHGMPARAGWPIARAIARRGIKPRPVLLRPSVYQGIQTVWEQAMIGAQAEAARRSR